MLEVMFTKSTIPEIKSFQKMSLQDACKISYQLEKALQEQENIVHVDFHILDQDNELYAGTLSLGAGYASHLYEHVENKLSTMEMDEEQEEQKEELLELMKQDIEGFLQEIAPPKEVKEPKENNRAREKQHVNEELTLEKRNKNKKHLFQIIGGAVSGIVVGAISVFSLYTVPTNSVEARTDQPDTHLVKGLQQASIQQYPKAIQEFEKLDYKGLDKESQKAVLFSYLLSGKATKAIQYEAKFAESVVAYYIGIDNIKKINEIDVKNDVIDFEKAALNKKYKDVIRLKTKVNMDGRREKLVAEAYVNQKKFDDCFAFAKTQGNKTLMKEVKELQKKDVGQSTLSEEEKKAKIEKIDKELSEI
ncbi:hypothetical protein COE15_13070 [Bacillus cereus]|nr:hypothetical protein COE15_13070 [Bacillus cereus]